jgi:hypothetical protein
MEGLLLRLHDPQSRRNEGSMTVNVIDDVHS